MPTEGDEEIRTQGASDFPSRELAHRGRLDMGPRESGLAELPETKGGIDVRTVRATLFSVDGGLRIGRKASV